MSAGGTEAITLRWYLDVLRERWRVVAGTTFVGVALSVLFLSVVGQSVTARSIVRLDVIATTPFESTEAASRRIDSATEVELASSFEVASRAAEALGDGTTARQIRDRTLVTSVANATVMDVTYTGNSAAGARRGADAVATAYLTYRSEEAQDRIAAYITQIDARLADLRTELAQLAAALVGYEPNSPEEIQASADRAVALQLMSSLTNQRYQLERIDTTAGAIISPATQNHVAYSPSRKLVMAGGLAGGALLGAALAFFRNATAKRIESARQLRWSLHAPVLGSLARRTGNLNAAAVAAADVRAVRARLVSELPPEADQLLVVDATESKGVAVAPFLLAASLLELGQLVNVVVAGASHAEQTQLAMALGLRAVDASDRASVYQAEFARGLQVSFTDGHAGREAFLAAVDGASRTDLIGDGAGATFTMVVLSGSADEDTRIVALASARAVVVFAALGKTLRATLAQIIDLTGGVLGTVTVAGRASRPGRGRHSSVGRSGRGGR